MAEVTMENVTKVFGEDVVAVQEMNLDIPDGEFVVFVGPSGCGKSTALRMIAGLEDITRGKVFIGDEVVNDRKTLQIHVRRLKFLTDDKTLPDSQLWGFIQGVLN